MLARVIKLPIVCGSVIIPGSIYNHHSLCAVLDIQADAVYYTDGVVGSGIVTSCVTYGGTTYTVSVKKGRFHLEHNHRTVASVSVPECADYNNNGLYFHISTENPLRMHIQFIKEAVELELTPD